MGEDRLDNLLADIAKLKGVTVCDDSKLQEIGTPQRRVRRRQATEIVVAADVSKSLEYLDTDEATAVSSAKLDPRSDLLIRSWLLKRKNIYSHLAGKFVQDHRCSLECVKLGYIQTIDESSQIYGCLLSGKHHICRPDKKCVQTIINDDSGYVCLFSQRLTGTVIDPRLFGDIPAKSVDYVRDDDGGRGRRKRRGSDDDDVTEVAEDASSFADGDEDTFHAFGGELDNPIIDDDDCGGVYYNEQADQEETETEFALHMEEEAENFNEIDGYFEDPEFSKEISVEPLGGPIPSASVTSNNKVEEEEDEEEDNNSDTDQEQDETAQLRKLLRSSITTTMSGGSNSSVSTPAGSKEASPRVSTGAIPIPIESNGAKSSRKKRRCFEKNNLALKNQAEDIVYDLLFRNEVRTKLNELRQEQLQNAATLAVAKYFKWCKQRSVRPSYPEAVTIWNHYFDGKRLFNILKYDYATTHYYTEICFLVWNALLESSYFKADESKFEFKRSVIAILYLMQHGLNDKSQKFYILEPDAFLADNLPTRKDLEAMQSVSGGTACKNSAYRMYQITTGTTNVKLSLLSLTDAQRKKLVSDIKCLKR